MYVSFAGFGIYRDGGFPGRTDMLQALAEPAHDAQSGLHAPIELFPPACYHRPAFAFACESETFAEAITGGCESINRQYGTSPAVTLAELRAARIFGGVLSSVVDRRAVALYEAASHVGRHPITGFPADLDEASPLPVAVDETLSGSAGGAVVWLGGGDGVEERVWLTDHLPRLAALAKPAGRYASLTLLLERGNPEVDFQRQGAIAALLGALPYRLVFVEPARNYGIDTLLVISPASQPPFLKSPHALRHLRDTIAVSLGTLPPPVLRKYYVFDSTAPGLPSEENQATLSAYLRGEGFQIVDLALLSFKERATLFRGAELVVGPMQSALAGTLFCPAGTSVVYVASEDEPDPFFWDLAACCAHRYAVCYGAPTAGGGFDVDLSVLIDALALQWTSLAQG